ncbi:cytochrome P450 [Paraphoma chrysanthemicola]|uniref:Cytochrome P450 n=1 Tax=Paraphoma chrysanthemicola TaxID=798071 RepID=A0A8K0RFJ8_9PLEO|nr:cytochrome P450 [Paraphoma chrysanthemicola]
MLHGQTALFSVAALIVLPFFTYYVTTLLFYRRVRSNECKKTPPTIPFYVPGVFHAFSLATSGPQEYIAQLMKDYGDFVPFLIKAGPQPFLIVRDPVHVKKALTASQHRPISIAHVEMLDKVFAISPSVLNKYTGKGASEAEKPALENAYVALTQKYLAGESLSALAESYISILSDNLHNKMFQAVTWTLIENSWEFFRQVITRCILQSLLGTDVFKQYPGIIRDYWTFAEAIDGFLPGMPRYWVPSAANQVRERLLRGIEKWLKANHSGSDFARLEESDPVLDNLKGAKFIQERDHVLANAEGFDLTSRAAEILSVIHEANSTLVSCTLWTSLEVMRREQLAKQLATSITRYSPSQGATWNIYDLTNIPIMDSLLAESFRLRTATTVAHIDYQSLQLDEHWTVPRKTPAILLSQDVALNTKAWAESRPRTVEKSLDTYWAERFLVPSRAASKANQRGQRNDVGGTAFSIEGLEHLNIGCTQRYLLGHDYFRTMHAATLAILFNEFELQLCDPELFDELLPPVRGVAFGILKPIEQVEVRIRKRKST